MMKIILALCALMLSIHVSAQEEFYKFKVSDQDGNSVEMNEYKGKVLLIVNTATKCGFTPQYAELQALYERYGNKGFIVLDFPCNQFGEQAPGSNAEIHNFCTSEYHVTFPQFDKIDVNGENAIPLYVWLKERRPFGGFNLDNPIGAYLHKMMLEKDPDYAKKPDIKWNFTKFLIDRNGHVVARFEPTAEIDELIPLIEESLRAPEE